MNNKKSYSINTMPFMLTYLNLRISLIVMLIVLITSCKNKAPNELSEEVVDEFNTESMDIPYIAGHPGQDTIIGNFTGHGLDSIWIVERIDTVFNDCIEYNYHTMSNNPILPSVELYGRSSQCAFIVNEGDLDGDGKDEWGWMRGSFSSCGEIEYHLVHLEGKKWTEFTVEFDAETRFSEIDLVKKGPKKGALIISFLYWPEYPTPNKILGMDTIFQPEYTEVMLHDN